MNDNEVGGPVIHPKHYNTGKYEVIKVIDDWCLGFSLGNALKYIARAPHKGTQLQDLRKAAFYLSHELERAKRGLFYAYTPRGIYTTDEVLEDWKLGQVLSAAVLGIALAGNSIIRNPHENLAAALSCVEKEIKHYEGLAEAFKETRA